MTREEVRQIVYDCLQGVAGGWVRTSPKLTTQQVAKALGRSKQWVLDNREQFSPERKNKRGDLLCDTRKVIEYLKN